MKPGRFRAMAETRVNAALVALERVAKIPGSGTSYTPEEATAVTRALRGGMTRVENAFTDAPAQPVMVHLQQRERQQ